MTMKMKRKSIIEEDGGIVVGSTRILHSQMDTDSKVLAWAYDLLGKENASDVRAFIQYCDDNGFAVINWNGAKTGR